MLKIQMIWEAQSLLRIICSLHGGFRTFYNYDIDITKRQTFHDPKSGL